MTALPGMTVEVVRTNGTLVGTDVTDAGGAYSVTIPCEVTQALAVRATDPTGRYASRYAPSATYLWDSELFFATQETGVRRLTIGLQPAGRFVPVPPSRVLDTRLDGRPIPQGESRPFEIVGLGVGGRGEDVTAVVLNVTATQGTAPSSFIALDDNPFTPQPPRSSVLNSSAGRDVANLVTVPITPGGPSTSPVRFMFYNNTGSTHLVADIAGYYSTAGGAGLQPVSPTRVLDTRESAPLGPRGTRRVDLAGAPTGAVAAAVTLTSTQVTAATTYVSAYPTGAAAGPTTSVLNGYRGSDVPNLAIVPLGEDGSITLYNDQGSAHLVLDVVGWYVSEGGADYHAIDTRRANGTRYLGARDAQAYTAQGADYAVPDDASAIALNLTTTMATAPSFLTVHPTDTPRPWASNTNARVGADTATAVISRLGQGFTVYNDTGNVLPIVDVSGYFAEHD
ncbi:hypothetical protein [Cellulomonas sp. NS3]|uniref:hypothetical protein n=1 Tax=Cellulomonas sp. NS3 TaxID=2973977 RepID=UPI002163040B|nr:hypothetical protein [Cellulomonas sp. NS3]